MEILYYAIKCKGGKSELIIEDKPDLLIKMKNFAIRDPQDFSADNFTQRQHQALKCSKGNKEIIIQRPGKGSGVVVMDKNTYDSKLGTLVSSQRKVSLIDGKQSESKNSKNQQDCGKVQELRSNLTQNPKARGRIFKRSFLWITQNP